MWFENGNINSTIITNLFHYPIGKSKEYSQLRQQTTDKYSAVINWILIVFLLIIPVKNLLLSKGYTVSGKIPLLKIVNLYLNKVIRGEEKDQEDESDTNREEDIRNLTLKKKFAISSKKWVYLLYYNSPSLNNIGFWSILLTILTLSESYHGDLIFIAKRLGRIANNCLPTILFLSLRPSPLPHTLYLGLLPIHKWLSRIIILQSILHTIAYCGFFQKNGTWAKAWKTENLYGWAALTGFLFIIITSILKMRNPHYKLFFLNHYCWTWIVVICLQFHVRPKKATFYTLINLSILFGQIFYRLKLSKTTLSKYDFKVTDVSPNLAYIEFPNYLISNKAINPGAHIRLTEYHPNYLVRLYKQIIPNYHPYTLVSLPQDTYQKLILRKSNFQVKNYHKYIVYGTFDPHLLFIKSKVSKNSQFSISKLAINAKKILIVVGGSAISFALPILRVMNYHGVRTKIVWVIKDFRDISILKYFDGFIHDDDFEIFVTGDFNLISNNGYGSTENNTETLDRMDPDLENQASELDPLINDQQASEIDDTSSSSNSKNYKDYVDLESAKHHSLRHENENENVDISIDNGDEEQSDNESECITDLDCNVPQLILNQRNEAENDIIEEDQENQEDICQEPQSPKTQASSLTNEAFLPSLSNIKSSNNLQIEQFKETVTKLRLTHRIYKGRPRLNYRYFNWCVNEDDIFTQCSGPKADSSGNTFCCRDLPRGNVHEDKLTPDASKAWVISAGPSGLVNNVKLWASENGLKFHEEAFYV